LEVFGIEKQSILGAKTSRTVLLVWCLTVYFRYHAVM